MRSCSILLVLVSAKVAACNSVNATFLSVSSQFLRPATGTAGAPMIKCSWKKPSFFCSNQDKPGRARQGS
jgi:hypothetical protein